MSKNISESESESENRNVKYICPIKSPKITNDVYINLGKQFGITYAILSLFSIIILIILYSQSVFSGFGIGFCICILWMLLLPVLFYLLFFQFIKYYDSIGEFNM